MNDIHKLSTGQHRVIRMFEGLSVEIAGGSFSVILRSFYILISKNSTHYLKIYVQRRGQSKLFFSNPSFILIFRNILM